jgi:hypothetical protein
MASRFDNPAQETEDVDILDDFSQPEKERLKRTILDMLRNDAQVQQEIVDAVESAPQPIVAKAS